MASQFEHVSSQKRYVNVRAILETGMILAGVVATLFLLPRRGPRFFLFASIPASLALALRLHDTGTELRVNLLTLIVFCLSVWVAIEGAIFDQDTLAKVCVANHFAQNYLCQYVPAFSVLWRPFMVHESLNRIQIFYIAYSVIVAIYLAAPILKVTVQQIAEVLQITNAKRNNSAGGSEGTC